MPPNLPAAFISRLSPAHTLPDPLPTDPFPIFQSWFDEAVAAKKQPNPNAMTLATVEPDDTPAARIILCRFINAAEGCIGFYTNYDGAKGKALARRPHACVNFFWDDWERQVRISGPVTRSPASESDAYFRARPWESRLSAWASNQSRPLTGRDQLLEQTAEVLRALNLSPDELLKKGNAVNIPRPPHWGGFRIWAANMELWLGGPGRFHDRARWTRTITARADGYTGANWERTRLQP
jgi:pyridoxamine 5'-phosphate oxidase